MKVPFNKIYYTGEELAYIKDALERKELSGDGYYTQQVSKLMERCFRIKRVLMTTSASHALEMAVMLTGIKEGDEVIMPSFTFPSTANAVLRQGGRPVFAEIDKNTLNIDPADIIKKNNHKTRAIIPVHYGGVGCDMDSILEIARKYKLTVIEDAAQGVNARYKDRYLGTWGDMGCYSFHSSKNYVSGEGGALAINCNNESLLERAEAIMEKGTDRKRFIKGLVDRYSWVEIGSSFLPSDLLMALLYPQLKKMEYIKSRRKTIHDYYFKHLQGYLKTGMIEGLTIIPESCESNYHLFYLLFNSEKMRNKVLRELKKNDISAAFHYTPLHSSKMGRQFGYQSGDLPITEKVSQTLLRLPLYTEMSLEDAGYVVKVLDRLFKQGC